ncbi:MAG: DUF1761 domain-containing protein [Bacteroidota bacterium]
MLLHSLVAALASLVVGFIWYNPKVFGTAWMKSIGKTEEDMKQGANMAVMFGMTFFFSFLIALFLHGITIHQFGIYSLLANYPESQTPGAKIELLLNGKNIEAMNTFRTFKHGAFHGILTSIFFALPVLGTNALFERRGAKYILIHTGYWLVTFAVMGGIVCAWV